MIKIGDSAYFEKTISESDVYQFAGICGDFNPIHVNQKEAEKSIFGTRIVHGMLAGSLISTVIGTKMPGEGSIYMEQDCKFVAPIKIGDTIKATVTFSEIINREKNIIKLDNIVTNQKDEVVIKGYSVVKVVENLIDMEA